MLAGCLVANLRAWKKTKIIKETNTGKCLPSNFSLCEKSKSLCVTNHISVVTSPKQYLTDTPLSGSIWGGAKGRGSVGFWLGWWGNWQGNCHPPGGMRAGGVESPVASFCLCLYPNRTWLLLTPSQAHCSWVPDLAVISGVS